MAIRKPTNTLKSTIFTDGTVREINNEGDELRLSFVDYCDSLIVITFAGVSRVLVGEHVVGAEIMTARFRRNGNGWVASFCDDDGETFLELAYERAQTIFPGKH